MYTVPTEYRHRIDEIQTEILRKSIHMMVAFVPLIAGVSVEIALMLLGSGILLYTVSEKSRLEGREVFIISALTVAATRKRDAGHFVLGPVTLGIGAMLALLLYPDPAATLAIYALAFGDGFAGLIGKLFGRVEIPFSGGKTFAGSLACLLSVFFVSYSITGSLKISILVSLTATFIEMLPLKDLDNIFLPVGTGLVAHALFFLRF